MKKRIALAALGLSLFSATAFAAVTVRYYNRDSHAYTFPAVCSGSKYQVSFSASTTSSTTIQGSAPCEVQTQAGKVILRGGENIEIKDGKIIVK